MQLFSGQRKATWSTGFTSGQSTAMLICAKNESREQRWYTSVNNSQASGIIHTMVASYNYLPLPVAMPSSSCCCPCAAPLPNKHADRCSCWQVNWVSHTYSTPTDKLTHTAAYHPHTHTLIYAQREKHDCLPTHTHTLGMKSEVVVSEGGKCVQRTILEFCKVWQEV